jgi:hypothetical protein
MTGILLLGLFLGTMAYFACHQDRLNRAMDEMDDTRREAGYVGPHLPNPGDTTGL